MTQDEIEQIIYKRMCSACPDAKYCHEEAVNCDEFLDELEREKEKHKDELEPEQKQPEQDESVNLLEVFSKILDIISKQKQDDNLQHYIDIVEDALKENQTLNFQKRILDILKKKHIVKNQIDYAFYEYYLEDNGFTSDNECVLTEREFDLLQEEFL